MTTRSDAQEINVDWMEDKWKPHCSNCYYFENTHCENGESEHHGHMLMPFHYACRFFEEK